MPALVRSRKPSLEDTRKSAVGGLFDGFDDGREGPVGDEHGVHGGVDVVVAVILRTLEKRQ